MAEMDEELSSEDDSSIEGNFHDNYDASVTSLARRQNNGPFLITVEGAGAPEVNGVYHQDGYFENACKYFRKGRWKNESFRFCLLQCHVNNNTIHWYISITPFGGEPGTSSDIDFYSAPVTPDCQHIPPSRGWVTAPTGIEPPPSLYYGTKIEDPGIAQGGGECSSGNNNTANARSSTTDETQSETKSRPSATQNEASSEEQTTTTSRTKEQLLMEIEELIVQNERLSVRGKQCQREDMHRERDEMEAAHKSEIASLNELNRSLQQRLSLYEQKEKDDQAGAL